MSPEERRCEQVLIDDVERLREIHEKAKDELNAFGCRQDPEVRAKVGYKKAINANERTFRKFMDALKELLAYRRYMDALYTNHE